MELPIAFREVVRTFDNSGMRILLHDSGEPMTNPATMDPLKTATSVTLFVGPEGGWSDTEIDLARSSGLYVISVGDYILRTETAALVGAAQLFALRRIIT